MTGAAGFITAGTTITEGYGLKSSTNNYKFINSEKYE
jgi:hypothetical protein